MTVSLSPLFNGWQGLNAGGLPLNAGQLFTYAAGTTTPQATYTTNTGLTQNANPIILGPDGRPPQEIWLTDGLSYKFQLNDSLGNPIATYDNIQSVGTLIQNFITSTTFLTSADGRYPIYVGTAGGTSDAITAIVATNITALYNGMIVSVDAIAANSTSTPTFTLTLGSTVTATQTIVDYNLQPLAAGAIAGLGHKLLLGNNSVQGKWVLLNPQPVVASAGTVSRRNTALVGPIDVNGFPSLLPQTVTGLTLTTQNIASIETVQTANVTTPVASPGVVTWTGHTLVANQAITFTTNGALPTGLVAGTVYYVLSPVTNTFNVSATPGGAAINFTGSTSGQSVAWAGVQVPLTATAYFGNDGVTGELNQIGQATANFSFPALPNNSTSYLYSIISSNGVMSHFSTTLVPIVQYANVTSPSITTGQITVNVVLGETYLGNGITASELPIVVWGTATTSGGNITATQMYNYGKPPTFSGKMSNSLLKVTTYTSAGTFPFIKSPQSTMVRVTVANGTGGGGGGSTGNGASGFAGGSGGNGGGCTISLFESSVVPSVVTVTVGAAGTSGIGGVNGQGTAGGNGGISSFGSLVSGGSASSFPLNDIVSITVNGGTCPGANLPGGHGFPGGRTLYAGWGGDGGAGGGGAGGMGGAFGSGGAGGGSNGTTTGTGANGATGIGGYVIVEEYN